MLVSNVFLIIDGYTNKGIYLCEKMANNWGQSNIKCVTAQVRVCQPEGRHSPTDIYTPCCAQRINAKVLGKVWVNYD